MTASPGISVVVNNYNYVQFLGQALDVALEQMREGDELIVVDDGSTDGSRELLELYRPMPGVRLVLQENTGQLGAVAAGIRAASNEVLVLLDSDDHFLEGYLDRLREIYAGNPDISFVSSHPDVRGDDPRVVGQVQGVMETMAFPTGKLGPSRWSASYFSEFVGVPTTGNSMRRAFSLEVESYIRDFPPLQKRLTWVNRLAELAGLRAPISQFSADGLIVRYASVLGASKFYDQRPGFYYRIHGGNRYAQLTPLQRRYQRYVRQQNFCRKLRETDGLLRRPTVAELRDEFSARVYPLKKKRRTMLKLRYAWLLLRSKGGLVDKTRAMFSLPDAGRA